MEGSLVRTLLCALAVQTLLNGANELGIITLKAAGHG